MSVSHRDLTDAVGSYLGKPCKNNPADVGLVKKLLNAHAGRIGLKPHLDVSNPHCGPRTLQAIKDFQRVVMQKDAPSGRVLPMAKGGTTLKALYASGGAAGEWEGDSARWTQEKKLRSMNPLLRVKVEKVLAALRKRGFLPTVIYGWRSVAVQLELFKKGRTKVKFSFHNAQTKAGTPNAWAADIVDSRWAWTPAAEANGFWTALGEEAKAEGLVWGGDWVKFRDVAHVQYYQNAMLVHVKKESGL